jgi:hypothetical protein
VIFFTTIRKQILTKVSIKARRRIFTPLVVVLRTIRTISTIIPTLISPTRTHITTINEFRNFLTGVIVSVQNTTQPRFISIPMMIGRENRTIREFKTNARAGSHCEKVMCGWGADLPYSK